MQENENNPTSAAAPTEQLAADQAHVPGRGRRLPWKRDRVVTAGAAKPSKGRATVLVAAAAGLLIGGLGGFGIGHADAGGHHGMRSAEGGYSASRSEGGGHGHGHGMRGRRGASGQSADGGTAAGPGTADNAAPNTAAPNTAGSDNSGPGNTAPDNG